PKLATERTASVANRITSRRILFMGPLISQVIQPARTIADAFMMNVEPVQDAQQQIACRDCPRRICEMTAAFELTVGATHQHVRYVVVKVLIGIAHVTAI